MDIQNRRRLGRFFRKKKLDDCRPVNSRKKVRNAYKTIKERNKMLIQKLIDHIHLQKDAKSYRVVEGFPREKNGHPKQTQD